METQQEKKNNQKLQAPVTLLKLNICIVYVCICALILLEVQSSGISQNKFKKSETN